jgi:hypothetical protein
MHADGDTALEVKRRQLVLNFIALLNFSLVFYLRVSGNKRRAVSYKCGCVCQNVQEGVMENAWYYCNIGKYLQMFKTTVTAKLL